MSKAHPTPTVPAYPPEMPEPLAGGVTSYDFRSSFNRVARASLAVSRIKGHFRERSTVPEHFARIHGQVADALRGWQRGEQESRRTPDFPVAAEQLADAVLRIMELAEACGYDLPGAIIAKLDHNIQAEPADRSKHRPTREISH